MPQQLTFDLPSRPALGRDAFFVSPANAVAVETIEGPDKWPGGKLVLVGPVGAGKTHLAHVWAQQNSAFVVQGAALGASSPAERLDNNPAIVVENIDRLVGDAAAQDALFHLHNLVLAEGGRLLMTSTVPPGALNFELRDLTSRVQATTAATLQAPDDALLAALLVKLFADRQLDVPLDVVSYLVSRIDRSFDGAQQIVAALDQAALAERRAITRPLAIRVLDNRADNDA